MATANENINIKVSVDTTKSEQSTTNYKQRIRELKEEMVALNVETNGLATATEEQRKRYAELEQMAGKLTDALGDVQSRIKACADDYQSFNAVMEGAKGITAFGQGVAGVTSLLGINNGAVEKSIQVMMSLQSVMSAINTVQQVFNKDSKVMVALQGMLTKATKTDTAAKAANTAATDAQAAASIGAAAATRSFTAALMSNPFGLIAVAIATVTTAIIGLTGAMDDDTTATERNTEAVGENSKAWVSNGAARREALKGLSGGLLSDIENKGLSTIEREGALLEFVNTKLGANVRSVKEAREVYDKFKDTTKELSMSMEVFANNGAQVHREFTTIREASISLANAQGELKKAQEYAKSLTEDSDQKYKDEAETELQKWEANVRYAEQMLGMLEKRTIEHYKSATKASTETAEKRTANIRVVASETAAAVDYIGQLERQINDEVYNAEEQTFEGRKKHLEQEIELSQAAFEQEAEDMLVSQNLTEEQYQIWLDKRETLLSQHLEKVQKQIDENDRERERKEVDAQNRIDTAVLETRLLNLKEGEEEWFEVQKEIVGERCEQELEGLRRQLEDGQILKEEFAEREKLLEAQKADEISRINKDKANILLEQEERLYEAKTAILNGFSNLFGAMQDAEIEDESKSEKEKLQIQKRYAIAGLLVNAAEAGVALATSIPKTLEAYSEIPFAGPLIAAVQIAATTAAIVAQIAKINQYQQKINKAAKGAFVVGASHQNGGVMMELEGGEAVLNKRAMAIPQYRAVASAMNVATGGVPFPNAGGGSVFTATVDTLTLRRIVKETVAGVASIPVVVSEEEISDTARKVNSIESRSRI